MTLEVGFNEIGVADEAEMVVPADDIAELFTGLGFPAPSAIPLMPLTFQVAQKLHAVTQPGNDRARDLIDLQLMAENATMDFARLNAFCKRLFAFRKRHPWPSTVVKGPKWDELYDSQKGLLPVLPTVDGAIVWANELIARITAEKLTIAAVLCGAKAPRHQLGVRHPGGRSVSDFAPSLPIMRRRPLHVLAYKKPFIFIYIPVRSAGGGLHDTFPVASSV